jgi:signal transduction histidine kinase
MTRRIAMAILLTVWATLVAGGAAVYLTARSVLLADLDASLVARAMSLPQVVDDAGHRVTPVDTARQGDRYLVRSDKGRTIARPTTAGAPGPQLLRAAFVTLPDGQRVRSVTLKAMAQPVEGGDTLPVSITYSGPTEQFDTLLRRLAWALVATGAAGGVLAAAIARAVAVRALAPLRATAEVVGSIDDRNLDRRVNQDDLPAELMPVAVRLNDMLARLEDSQRHRQQFLADASHELRTPVAALLASIEVALRRDRDSQSYRQTLESCLGWSRRYWRRCDQGPLRDRTPTRKPIWPGWLPSASAPFSHWRRHAGFVWKWVARSLPWFARNPTGFAASC